MLKTYKTFNISYNEEKNIDTYLDRYGHEILRAIKGKKLTTAQGVMIMRASYGESPVNRWVARHHIVLVENIANGRRCW